MSRIYVTRAVECPTLAEVSDYMTRNGWEKVDEQYEYWLFMKGDECVSCPNKVDYFEFHRQMSDALDEIANTLPEGMCSADIYDDIVKHRSEK